MAHGKDSQLVISPFLEKAAVAYNQEHELLLLTTIKAPQIENEARDSRAPIDLVAVIDRSGSMTGEKLDLVLKTMAFVVEQLKAADKLCIVAYDTYVDVVLTPTCMDAAGKKLANGKLSTIKANGQTNLSGGLMAAIAQLTKMKAKNAVASIMLFTDGCANCGVTTTASLVTAINNNLINVDTACSIFTFGFGTDHEENMLKEIAEAGKGMYYYIETLDDIPKSFGDCLGGLLSVAAQNIVLKLEGIEGVTIKKMVSKIQGSESASGKVIELNLGDIYCEEERDILVTLHVPAVVNRSEEFIPAINISLSYFNVIATILETKETTVLFQRPESTPPNQPVNMSIDKQRNRLTAASAMEKATTLGHSDRDQARLILENVLVFLKLSASAKDPFTKALIDDVESCMRDLANLKVDYSSVKKKMSQKSQSHERQRGMFDSGLYSSTMKTSLKTSFSSYSKTSHL